MKKTILTLLLILAALPAVVSAADLSTWPATFQNNSLITPSMLNELRDTVNSKADRSEIAFGAWAESTSYAQYDIVANMGVLYACTVAHASTVLNEPGIGGVWETVWSVATGTADADLDEIAALSTLPWGRGLLTLSDASAARIALGLVIGTDVLAPTGDGSGLTGITTIESDPIFAAKETGYDNHVIDADKHPLSTSGTDSLTLPGARSNLILPGNLTAKSSTYELTTVLPATPVNNQRIVTDGAVLQVYAEQGTDIWGYFWCAACDSGAGQWIAEWNYTEGARLTSASSSITDVMIDWGTGAGQVSLDDIPDGTTRVLGAGGTGTGGYVPLPTYSDDPCSLGQWSLDLTTSPERRYICVSTDTWGYEEITLTGWNNPAPTALLTEGFETATTGYENVWTEVNNGGTFNPVYTGFVGGGLQSHYMRQNGGSTNSITSSVFTAQSTIYFRHWVRWIGSTASYFQGYALLDASDNVVSKMRRSSGDWECTHGTIDLPVAAMVPDTDYYIWGKYVASTGSDGVLEITIGTTGVKSAGTTYTLSNGDATASVNRIQFNQYGSFGMMTDLIEVSTTELGDF